MKRAVPEETKDPCEGLKEMNGLYMGEPEEQRVAPGGPPSWQRALIMTLFIGVPMGMILQLYADWRRHPLPWVALLLALAGLFFVSGAASAGPW